MAGLPFRHRLICFLSIAAPAGAAFLTGRLITNAARMVGPHILAEVDGRSPTRFTRNFLGLLAVLAERNLSLARLGDIAAIAIAVLGFIVVRRLPPEAAQRAVMLIAVIAWSVEALLLMLSLIALSSPFNT